MGLRTRPNITPEQYQQMKDLEAAGKSRSEIAKIVNCTGGCVTRRLGRKRAVSSETYARDPEAQVSNTDS